jgi:hypothetical protein
MALESAILLFYRSEFERLKIKPQQNGVALQRCAWMIQETLKMYEENTDLSKINRWIGFVQGVLWKEGIYNIDELRGHITAAKAFDFLHVLFLHSGLKGWELESGDPTNFTPTTPITFIYKAELQFIQRAIFTLDAKDNVYLSINDRPALTHVHISCVRFLYDKGKESAQDPLAS